MTANATAARIARETGRNYHDVRIAINRAEALAGLSRADAEEVVEKMAVVPGIGLASAVDRLIAEASAPWVPTADVD